MKALRVVRPGLLDLVVDGVPRRGLAYGLAQGGPMDLASFARANLALGNPPYAAAVEMTAMGPMLRAEGEEPLRVAVSGAGMRPVLDGIPMPLHEPFWVAPGQELRMERQALGLRAYLALEGGVAAPTALGSASYDPSGILPGWAGRALSAGDLLEAGKGERRAKVPWPPGWLPPPAEVPDPSRVWEVAVWPGPQFSRLPPAARRSLVGQVWRVSPQASRMGLRLMGQPIWDVPPQEWAGERLSEPTALGSVQIPPDGLPVVLHVDRGTVGGYPVALVVATSSIWSLAQARPGQPIRLRGAARHRRSL